MKTKMQSELLKVVSDILDLTPEMRFGQLVALMGDFGQMEFDYPLAEVEDDQILTVLQRHRSDLIAHGRTTAKVANSDFPPLFTESK